MNDPQERNGSDSRSKSAPRRSKSTAGGIAIAVVLLAYSFAAPALNARFGWNLPRIGGDSQSQLNPEIAARKGFDPDSRNLNADRTQDRVEPLRGTASTPPRTEPDPPTNLDADETSTIRETKPAEQTRTTSQPRGPLTESAGQRSNTQRGPPQETKATETKRDTADDDDLRYGLLREISADRYISPAGLLYTPGSAEGHRLEHVRRHAENDPGRPGSHGVFDGGMEGTLQTIDQAYERAKNNQRTTKKTDQGRTIYTVDMGKRIGYVGGRDGGRRRNPMARRVRLVLEGNRVITAYPM